MASVDQLFLQTRWKGMISFLYYWEKYKKVSTFKIFINLFRYQPTRSRAILYTILCLTIFVSIVFFLKKSELMSYILLILTGLVWGYLINKLEKNLYKDIYVENRDLINLYKIDKLFLRYLLFKKSLDPKFKELNKIQQAIDFINIELNILPSIPVFSNQFFNLLIAIFIACIGAILSKLSKEKLILISYLLVVILLFLSSMIGSYKTRKMKLKELKTFLEWLKLEV